MSGCGARRRAGPWTLRPQSRRMQQKVWHPVLRLGHDASQQSAPSRSNASLSCHSFSKAVAWKSRAAAATTVAAAQHTRKCACCAVAGDVFISGFAHVPEAEALCVCDTAGRLLMVDCASRAVEEVGLSKTHKI